MLGLLFSSYPACLIKLLTLEKLRHHHRLQIESLTKTGSRKYPNYFPRSSSVTIHHYKKRR
jgi:hypothetical protein